MVYEPRVGQVSISRSINHVARRYNSAKTLSDGTLAVIVLLLLLLASSQPATTELTFIRPADGLSLHTARALDGQRIVVSARLIAVSLTDSQFVYSVRNDRLELTLWLPKDGPDLTGRTVTAEATVRVVYHPRRGTRGAYREVRLVMVDLRPGNGQ
jgi:hypothetical protein